MTYSVGGLIEAPDYNSFVSTGNPNLNNIWSAGSNNSGYGQTALPSTSAGVLVSATQWANLINTISTAASHQGTVITSIPAPVSGALINHYSALTNNLSSINAGRLNAVAVGTDITSSATRSTQWGGAAGVPIVTSTVTVTFSSETTARYFFNAGGTIRLSASATGGTGTSQDLAWQQLLTDIGTLVLPAVNSTQIIAGTSLSGFTKLGGGGTAPDIYNRNGYYQLGTSPQTLFRQLASGSVYSTDYLEIIASVTGSVVTFSIRLVDNTSGGSSDIVDSDITITATVRPPSTTYLTNTWGVPLVSVTPPA